MSARITASADLSGKHTERPLGDGVVRFDVVYPLERALEWYRANGRLLDPYWITDEIKRLSPNPNMPEWHNRISLDSLRFLDNPIVYDPDDHTLDALRYTMGTYPVRSKRRYKKAWLRALSAAFRPRARFTKLPLVTFAFLVVAGASFGAGMLTTILLSL